MGPNAHPRTDGALTLLLPAVENTAKAKPQVQQQQQQAKSQRSKSSRSYMTAQSAIERVSDPNAHKWSAMNTDYQMRTMMALTGGLVDKGDRGSWMDHTLTNSFLKTHP
jgi:hypothetical protein